MSNPSRLIVFSPNWLGDAVMAIPCLEDVRRAWPNATLAVAARTHLVSLFEMVAVVDDVVALEPAGPRAGLGGALRAARELRGRGFDVAILLPNSFRSAAIARLARIPERWGYATDARSWLLTRAIPRVRGGHQVEYYRRLLAGLPGPVGRGFSPGKTDDGVGRGFGRGKTDTDTRISLRVPPRARDHAHALLAEHGWRPGEALVGMAPGAAYGTAKQWLPERFAQLAAELATEGVRTVLVGSNADRSVCDEIQQKAAEGMGLSDSRTVGLSDSRTSELSDSRTFGLSDSGASVINLAGRTDLQQLAAVIAECRSFVTNDSGAMHVAAAVGVAVTAVIGPTREWETGPLPVAAHRLVIGDVACRPCMLRECPTEHECMVAVGVERVKAAVMGQLQNR